MSGKSQKILKTTAIIILSVVAVVFLILFFTGRVGDFIGVTSDTSSSSGLDSVQSVVSSTEQSDTGSVYSSSSGYVSGSADISSSSSQTSVQSSSSSESAPTVLTEYKFRSKSLLEQHYQKHGRNMGFKSAEEYEKRLRRFRTILPRCIKRKKRTATTFITLKVQTSSLWYQRTDISAPTLIPTEV